MKWLPILLLWAAPLFGQTATVPTGTPDATITMAGGNPPSYGSVAVTGASTWTWADKTPCWYSAGSFTVTVTLTDSVPHQVALYMVDDDKQGREQTVSSGSVQSVSSFTGGVYSTWSLTGPGTFPFVIARTAGINAVVTSVAFYTPGAPVGPPLVPPVNVTVLPPYTLTIAWQESDSRATSFNVWRNGVKYASVLKSPFIDTGVVAGGVYSYAVSAVDATEETAPVAVSAFQIPSP